RGPHGGMAPAQGVRQAGDRLPARTGRGAAPAGTPRPGGQGTGQGLNGRDRAPGSGIVGVMTTTPALAGQAVVVIRGSAGMGLETARLARAEGAEVILAARDPERLERAAAEVGAVGTAAFDATDPAALDRFFAGLPEQIDHIMVTGPGPYYAPLAELDRDLAHREFDVHLWLPI